MHPTLHDYLTPGPDRRSAPAEFLDCPAYLDEEGAARCALPAEVTRRYTMGSTDGPLDSVMIRCPSGHWFNGPIEFLTADEPPPAHPLEATRSRAEAGQA